MSTDDIQKRRTVEATAAIDLALGANASAVPAGVRQALIDAAVKMLMERDRLMLALAQANEQPTPKFSPDESLLNLLHRCQNGLATCRYAANEIENYIEAEIASRLAGDRNPESVETTEIVLAGFFKRAALKTR